MVNFTILFMLLVVNKMPLLDVLEILFLLGLENVVVVLATLVVLEKWF